jgi:hypothetical protein
LRAKSDKKRMVVMMGPPAAGKGFFLGEPVKGEGPPKDKYGWKLPEMLVDDEGKPLLTEEDIPDRPSQDESDNHLRAIQFKEAANHFEALKAAHEQGEEQFKSALADHWYSTKDGGRVELSSVIEHGKFPKDFSEYFEKANKDFYVSMRGWHDDAAETNQETGKTKERFKDQARKVFDASVAKKIQTVDDMLIVDSAGEDIDVQDYKAQIEQAKASGFEVTVIFLHPEQADTELSNLARGKVMGKRMVDQADITNWYERNAKALQGIQAASPDNFCHYRKGPPDDDPKKAAELRGKARDLMNKLQGIDDPKEKEAAKAEINQTLYVAAKYKLNKSTSYGVSLSGQPKEPQEKSIADAVQKMNEEATSRAGGDKKEPAGKPGKEDKKPQSQNKKFEKVEKKKTRQNFLREMGDKKVSNPNPESRHRTPQIKIRSLPWTYQKPYWEQWSRAASAQRVAHRYYRRIKMAGDWLQDWMESLADQIGKIKVEGYEIETEAGQGPEVYATIKGGAEDATAGRKAREQIEKIIEASIKKNSKGVSGFKARVRSYNKGEDLLLECTVSFP